MLALLTFPGIIIHEIGHRFFCDILNIKVYEVMYFNLARDISGHVIHEITQNVHKQFLIAMGPLLINTFFCMLFTFPYSLPNYWFGEQLEYSQFINALFLIMYWVGFSAGVHAFPSNIDLNSLEKTSKEYYSDSVLTNSILGSLLNFFRIIEPIKFLLQLMYAFSISQFLPSLILP